MPLYLLVVVDGNGESEIVGLFLVVSEGEETIRKMTEIFKNHNDYHIFVKTIITDKDFTEREVLATEFEGADLIICRFHVQRNFRREVTTAKLGISENDRQNAFSGFTKVSLQQICRFV